MTFAKFSERYKNKSWAISSAKWSIFLNRVYITLHKTIKLYSTMKTFILKLSIYVLTISLGTQIIQAQNLKETAMTIMKRDSIPEMTFAVVTQDKVLIKEVIGHHKISELSKKSNASLEDYFHLGSNTKAITGFIAGYLVEQGKIKWHTRFFDLFPKLKEKSNANYHKVTLEALLSHTAKVPSFTSGAEFEKLPKFEGNIQEKRTAFAKHVLTLPEVKSETIYNYSNAGYSVATQMLEKVSGKSWEELVEEVFKKRLKLNIAFGWPNRNFENQPFGHYVEDGKVTALAPEIDYNLAMIEPAGDLSLKIEDYAKFIQMNIEGLSGKSNFLKAETYQYLHKAKKDYAIGWANYVKEGKDISGHAGSDGSFYAYVQIDRKKLLGYIVIVNNGSAKAEEGLFEMLEILKKKYSK